MTRGSPVRVWVRAFAPLNRASVLRDDDEWSLGFVFWGCEMKGASVLSLLWLSEITDERSVPSSLSLFLR